MVATGFGFTRPRCAGEVYRIADFQIRKRPIGQSLNMRGCYKPVTGLRQDIVALWLHPDHTPKFSALCFHHWYAHFSVGKNQCFLDLLNAALGACGKRATGGWAAGDGPGLAALCRCGSAFVIAGGGVALASVASLCCCCLSAV